MEHSRGLPTSAYLYLGMEEIGGRYGWYYSDCWAQYYATDCNTEQSDQIYREMMQERMQAMKAQPGYLRGFYQGKLHVPVECPDLSVTVFQHLSTGMCTRETGRSGRAG